MRLERRLLLGFASPLLVAACGSGGNSASSGDASADAGASGQGSSGSSGSSSGDGTASGSSESGTSNGGTGGTSSGTGGDDASGGSPDSSRPPAVEAGVPMPIGDQTLPRKLYIENDCTQTIWVEALPHTTFPNSAPLEAAPGQAFVAGWPNNWSGRIWGRTECTGTTSYTSIKCAQTGNDTLAEFTLTAGMNEDWYDISCVDGFTLPLGIIQVDAPWHPSASYVTGGKLGVDGQCGSPVCAENLLTNCPASQQMKDATGKTTNVVTCKNGESPPSTIPAYFKAGCPTAYSWPYDDPQSLFTCPDFAQNTAAGAYSPYAKDYKVIFCPTQGTMPGFPPMGPDGGVQE
jgi:hypothetical protein